MGKKALADNDIIKMAKFFVKNQSTLRKTSQIFGISKSCLHKHFTKKLKTLNHKLFLLVQKNLQKNKKEKHLRGGQSTKQRFLIQHF